MNPEGTPDDIYRFGSMNKTPERAAIVERAKRARRRKSPYGHICSGCDHPGYAHGLVADAESVAGPYRCKCGCEIMQHSPSLVAVDRWRWEQYLESHPEWDRAREGA